MTGDVQLDEAPRALLTAARQVVPPWLHRVATRACARGGDDPNAVAADLDRAVDAAADGALRQLADLLATDVDHQRTTPLTILRDATAPIADVLRSHGVTPPASTPSSPAADEYQLEPATWADVDPSLHEPGIAWGAWKAMTVLTRRRDEGRR